MEHHRAWCSLLVQVLWSTPLYLKGKTQAWLGLGWTVMQTGPNKKFVITALVDKYSPQSDSIFLLGQFEVIFFVLRMWRWNATTSHLLVSWSWLVEATCSASGDKVYKPHACVSSECKLYGSRKRKSRVPLSKIHWHCCLVLPRTHFPGQAPICSLLSDTLQSLENSSKNILVSHLRFWRKEGKSEKAAPK